MRLKPLAEVRPQWSEGHECLRGQDTFRRRLPGKWFARKGLMEGMVIQPMKGLKEGVIHRNCKTQSLLAPVPARPRFIIRSAFNLAHVEELAIHGNKVSVNFAGSSEVSHKVDICNFRNWKAFGMAVHSPVFLVFFFDNGSCQTPRPAFVPQ